jgi:hypothetical protein
MLQAKGSVNISDVPKPISLGQHGAGSISNYGANDVYLSSRTNSTPNLFLLAGTAITMDDFEDPEIYLSCASGLTTTVLVNTWGTPYPRALVNLLASILDTVKAILRRKGN